MLSLLLSARISADVGVAAARELFGAGFGTPAKMRDATWQQRVDALGRGRYRRYDERTATMLGETSERLLEQWQGDLRKLHEQAGSDPRRIAELLQEFKGIGKIGADIFLREVQVVWTDLAPYADDQVAEAARQLGLPVTARGLGGVAADPAELARLGSALIRVTRSAAELRDFRDTPARS